MSRQQQQIIKLIRKYELLQYRTSKWGRTYRTTTWRSGRLQKHHVTKLIPAKQTRRWKCEEEKIAIKSTSVDLPAGDALSPGPNADAINNNCLACHSTDMVLNQPALPQATWDTEVHKMITAYRAPVDEADVGAIVDYLVKTKGKS
jgi:hypothetical protein